MIRKPDPKSGSAELLSKQHSFLLVKSCLLAMMNLSGADDLIGSTYSPLTSVVCSVHSTALMRVLTCVVTLQSDVQPRLEVQR